ncbi:MAG: GTP-binding protein [Promethearchaeota archaeon]
MVIRKQESISILLKNFVESQKDVLMTFLYSRQGLIISKYGKHKIKNIDDEESEQLHGALTSLVENLLKKISMEYKIGHFGTGSFETPEHRIIFVEAGPEAILLCVCEYKTDLNKLFPVAYLVVEKIAQLLEESFDFKYNNLEIPDLAFHDDFSLKLEQYTSKKEEPLFDSVYITHRIKRPEKRRKLFKLVILGSAAVGKTTLVNSFLKKEQITDYRPTLGISISTQKYYIQGFKDDIISFLVYDLAGQDFFKRVRHEYYKGASCVFVVYDITKRESFEESVDFWFADARKELGDIPFVLIGNKIDLEDQREVPKEEGLKKAEELRSLFIETSALKNINVQDTFKLVGIGLFFKSIDQENNQNLV